MTRRPDNNSDPRSASAAFSGRPYVWIEFQANRNREEEKTAQQLDTRTDVESRSEESEMGVRHTNFRMTKVLC